MTIEQDRGTGAIVIAFVFGALTGAAVALMWAPMAGTETRRYVGARAREGADRASQTAREIGERVREGRVADLWPQGKSRPDRAQDRAPADAREAGEPTGGEQS